MDLLHIILMVKNETFCFHNPHFSTILRPFGVLTHVESVVCLTRK